MASSVNVLQQPVRRVDCLDGLRGIAALWVLLGHAMILTGYYFPIVGDPDLGVDLFVMLSGFVMAFQTGGATRGGALFGRETARFYLRRFFRIAPLYYCMLAVALLAGGVIYQDRVFLDEATGRSPQLPTRYLDYSFENIILHLTFLFGFIPEYSYRTPLPDWSIGLEMQFYLVFPVVAIAAARFGWWRTLLVSVAIGVAFAGAARLFGFIFPMPSFLALKFHVFAAGMLLGAICCGRVSGAVWSAIVGATLVALPIGGVFDALHTVVRVCVFLTFYFLISDAKFGPICWLSWFLAQKIPILMGELSYGVYLIHLLFMHHVSVWAFGVVNNALFRFFLVSLVTSVLTYSVAWITYKTIELPGQRFGRRVAKVI